MEQHGWTIPGHGTEPYSIRFGLEPSSLYGPLARNGQCGAALGYSERALRLGTQDALKFFHRGMIESCLGHQADAKAWFRKTLALNPQFSVIWSPVAAKLAP